MNADAPPMAADGCVLNRVFLARVRPSTFLKGLSAGIGGASAFIGVLTVFFITVSTAAEISLTDDAGRKVELKAPAQRIVTMAPFLTELAFSAGAGDRVVGVSAHSDYPPQARGLPEVGSALAFSIEPIAAMRPDLALVWKDSVRSEDLKRLEAFGVAVFVAQARTLEDVPRLLVAIGRLAGRDPSAAVEGYRATLARLRERHAGRPGLRAFLEIWHAPLTTLAGPHWINEALELCGARNAFRDLPGIAPQVSWEEVYARDPQVIVGAGSARSTAEFRGNWGSRRSLEAVRQGRLVFVEADIIQRPTLRLAEGVAKLCAGLERAR
jgi:iron complex transport system substrate-binding protein